jgi:hypothetical protein
MVDFLAYVYMTAAAQINQELIIDGKRYVFEGTVDFKDVKLTPQEGNVPDPDPDPGVPKPVEGTIKEGGWGASTDAKTWKVVNMRNPPELFKVVDDKGINVATHFSTAQTAEGFIAYFKVNPFPPVDENNPTPVPTPTPGPTPGGTGFDKNGVQLLYSKGTDINYTIKNNFRDDGKRFDANVGDWPASEATAY